jgi:mRNA (2'-O-methyladenosine-N6-)-methyltransferase
VRPPFPSERFARFVRLLQIAELCDDGLFFMWVTGRAMELGRELLEQYG